MRHLLQVLSKVPWLTVFHICHTCHTPHTHQLFGLRDLNTGIFWLQTPKSPLNRKQDACNPNQFMLLLGAVGILQRAC